MKNRISIIIMSIISIITSGVALEVNTDGQRGVIRTLSAKTFGKGTINVGTGFSFSQSSDYLHGQVSGNSYQSIKSPDGKSVNDSVIESARLFSSNLYLAINPFSFLDVALSLPFYYDWSGITGIHDGGLGDLRLSLKINTPSAIKAFQQGYYISGTIPTGMKSNGIFPRHSYMSDGKDVNPSESFYSARSATLTGLLLLTLDAEALKLHLPIQVHANLGGSVTSSEGEQRNLISGGLAVEYSPLYFLTVFIDLSGETRVSNLSTDIRLRDDPILLTPGFKITTSNGIYMSLSADFSLSSKTADAHVNWKPSSGSAKGYEYSTGSTPSYGAQFVFGWNGFIAMQDDDHDGIKNDVDRCPKDPEDFDGFEDSDGCPDYDNDKDGIVDVKDKCPNLAEDLDGFKDDDGCPDLDNDSDGIADIKDKCPNAPEDFDGFEDSDGCPDYDNDKDGVVDSLDKCPNVMEDFDGFEDSDGCPDPDNDKDGILDANDKCMNQPETYNNFKDDDGCPDTVKKEPDIPNNQVLSGVQFRNNGPELTFNSYQFIEPFVRKLIQFPDVEIEVRAYTDSLGDYAKNMQLSQMRAEAVRQYIISKGIDSKRIRAVGFGASNPVADNRTASGRAQNRRIEVVRVK